MEMPGKLVQGEGEFKSGDFRHHELQVLLCVSISEAFFRQNWFAECPSVSFQYSLQTAKLSMPKQYFPPFIIE